MFDSMFENLHQKKQNFKDTAHMVIDCQNGVMHSIFQQLPYILVFKTTNWCWNNCAHCCESAGPNMPKKFIPESVITNYIDQAVMDKNFSRSIVFTGGEITAAYKFVGRDYMKNIINHALNAGCSVDIKTNAGWVNSPELAPMIYSDIEEIVSNQIKNSNISGPKHIVPFQVSLSLDQFHKDAVSRNLKFLEHFANKDIPGATFTVHLSSIRQESPLMFQHFLRLLGNSGINIGKLFVVSKNKDEVQPFYDLNGNIVIEPTDGLLFNGGRAKNIEYAFKTPFPQFTFITPDHKSLVAFDSFGNVTLGENSGKKISVPWTEPETGAFLPLETVRKNLLTATKQAEQDFLREHKAMNVYFNWVRYRLAKEKTRK